MFHSLVAFLWAANGKKLSWRVERFKAWLRDMQLCKTYFAHDKQIGVEKA
jgi:hypothetical protein